MSFISRDSDSTYHRNIGVLFRRLHEGVHLHFEVIAPHVTKEPFFVDCRNNLAPQIIVSERIHS